MQVGTASIEITPDRPLPLQGQMNERIAQFTRDPLTVNVAAFDAGGEPVVIVSCDLVALDTEWVRQTQMACEQAWGVPAERVLLATTHTHVGPVVCASVGRGEIDPDYLALLGRRIVKTVGRALLDREPATLYAGEGHIPEMGWNRRGLRRDGTAQMYHGSWHDDFAGIEGSRDGAVPVLVARREDQTVKLVLTGFATHPNCVEGEHYYCADLPGAVRRFLHRELGPHLTVLYLTGAAGDTAPTVMESNPGNRQPWRGEQGLERSGRYLGAAVLQQVLSALEPMRDPTVALASETLTLGHRPWPADLDPASFQDGGMRDYFTGMHDAWPRFLQEHPTTDVRLNVVRLGDFAICTNPAELYVDFGLALKASSPACITMVSELTDGYCGYVSTRKAFAGGGYSVWPAYSAKLEVAAGERIVTASSEMLQQVYEPATTDAAKEP